MSVAGYKDEQYTHFTKGLSCIDINRISITTWDYITIGIIYVYIYCEYDHCILHKKYSFITD